jgi:hypothetical protein
MSIRKRYWNKVKKCLLKGDAKTAAEMIMAIFSCDVEKVAELYRAV